MDALTLRFLLWREVTILRFQVGLGCLTEAELWDRVPNLGYVLGELWRVQGAP